jgi:hypothetical protein
VKAAARASLVMIVIAILVAPKLLCSQNAADEQSCRSFVQRFYDWYWNQYADRIDDPNFQIPADHAVSKLQPPAVDPKIFRAMNDYEKRINNPKTNPRGGSSILEYWDPFLNSDNGVHGKFQVVHVDASGDHCLAAVRGSSEVQPELRRVGGAWLIIDFYYPDAKSENDRSLMRLLSH